MATDGLIEMNSNIYRLCDGTSDMSDTYAPLKYVKIWGILLVLLAISI